MNALLRTTLLALLALVALTARAMPCLMTATPVVTLAAAPAAHEHGHCDEPAAGTPAEAPLAHAGMSLGDCLAALPALPATDAAVLAAARHVEPAPLLMQPAFPRPADAGLPPAARPPPDPATTALASAHWSSTQRLLL